MKVSCLENFVCTFIKKRLGLKGGILKYYSVRFFDINLWVIICSIRKYSYGYFFFLI